MLFIYAPAGGPRREWTWRPGDVESLEAEAIEDATDWPWGEFGRRFMNGSAKAKRAVLWTLLRRDDPRLAFAAVSFRQDEVFVGWEPDEAAAIRTVLQAADPDIPDDQREALLEQLETVEALTPVEDTPAAAVPEQAGHAVPEGKGTAGDDAPGNGM